MLVLSFPLKQVVCVIPIIPNISWYDNLFNSQVVLFNKKKTTMRFYNHILKFIMSSNSADSTA